MSTRRIDDQERALGIVRQAMLELEPLYDYVPGRPLGWLDLIMSGVFEELQYKVWKEGGCICGDRGPTMRAHFDCPVHAERE